MSNPDPAPKTTRLDPAEFVERFVTKMLRVAGPTFEDGDSIEAYARETAPSYFDEQHQDGETPEDCASADVSYWEH